MALVAVALPTALAPSTDTTRLCVQLQFVVLATSIGTYTQRENSVLIENLDPQTVSILRTALENALEVELEAHGVTVGPLDTLIVY